jgi:hypothetical protein
MSRKMTRPKTDTIPRRNHEKTNRFSSSIGSDKADADRENSLQNIRESPRSKSIPTSKLPIRSASIYQSHCECSSGSHTKPPVHVQETSRIQLEERIIALELLNDRLRAEVDEHRKVNVELLKTCQGLRYAQMTKS